MIKAMFKNLRKIQLFASVPPELKEEFTQLQLKNNIKRIRILSVVLLFNKILNVFLYTKTADYLESDMPLYLIHSLEVIGILIFNLGIIIFKKQKTILWLLCYSFIFSNLTLYVFTMSTVKEAYGIAQIFLIIFPFVIIPDFKPFFFVLFSTLFFLAAQGVLNIIVPYEIADFQLFTPQSLIFNIFIITLIAKIVFYNSKVKTFINSFEIRLLNDNLVSANAEIERKNLELQNYTLNLENMVNEKTKTIVDLKNAVMETIAEMVERRDDATGGHITRTSRYLKIFIDSMLLNRLYHEQTISWNIDQMILSAQLHDVGKIAIDDSILRKPGKLSDDEFEQMKKHTVFGGEIIKEVQKKTGEREFLDYANTFAVYHHEKWDGSGYPYGISNDDIPLPARIMALIDVYDALISERPYKKALTHGEAILIINNGDGSHFDPALIKLFMSISDSFRDG